MHSQWPLMRAAMSCRGSFEVTIDDKFIYSRLVSSDYPDPAALVKASTCHKHQASDLSRHAMHGCGDVFPCRQ